MIDASRTNPTSTHYSQFDSAHHPTTSIEEDDCNDQKVKANDGMFAAQLPNDFGRGFLV